MSNRVAAIERFIVSIALSIALASIIGLALYYSPLGYSLTSITLGLFLITIILANVSVYLDVKKSPYITN